MNFLLFAQGAQLDLQGIVSLTAGLGQTAGVVTMAWLFIKFLQDDRSQQEKRDERIFAQFAELAKDRGQIIRDNTLAMTKIEASVDRLIDVAERTVSTAAAERK